jgi:hypothetical protein
MEYSEMDNNRGCIAGLQLETRRRFGVTYWQGWYFKKDVMEYSEMDNNRGWIAGLQLETKCTQYCGGVDSTFDFPIGSVGLQTFKMGSV